MRHIGQLRKLKQALEERRCAAQTSDKHRKVVTTLADWLSLWKHPFTRWAYRLKAYLLAKGIENRGCVRALKRIVPHRFTSWLDQHQPLLIETHGMLMHIYPNTYETVAYLCQRFEPYTTELFERAITPGATVVDIGAQFGYFSLIAAKRAGQDGRVYAFEPAPANVELLKRNVQLNGYAGVIRIVTKAVGATPAAVSLFVYRGSDSHSLYRHPRVAVKERLRVGCVTVDDFLGGRPVDVVKIDIEGHEPYALQGMKQTVAGSAHLILFVEFAPAYLRRAGVEPHAFLGQLANLDFHIQLIDERSRCLRPVPTGRSWRPSSRWYANLYCTRTP